MPWCTIVGADLGFSKGEVKPCSGSLKQEVWGTAPQKLRIGYLVFEVSKLQGLEHI